MSTDDKTPARSPYALAVEEIVSRQLATLKVELARMIRDSAAQTAAAIGNALGVWRAEVDQQLNDHESRIRHLERVVESRSDTEPPPPSGMQQQ